MVTQYISSISKLKFKSQGWSLICSIGAYAATTAILGAFSVFQTGLVDRENKAKLNKIVEHIERLEG